MKSGDTYILDAAKSSNEGLLVFGNFSFPIIDKYETDMLCNIKEWGYEDVRKEIWFCHRPIHGTPCGLCHPCDVKMESEMEFLLPEAARKRYLLHKKFQRIFRDRITEKFIVPFLRKIYQ